MLKMIVQAHRKRGFDDAVFYARWQHGHGDLVKRLAPAMGWRRYVQSHRVDDSMVQAWTAARDWADPTSDGLAELWWDSQEAMDAAMGMPAGQRASHELEIDEQAFTDTARLSALLAVENVVFGQAPARPRRPSQTKLVIEFHRRPDLSRTEFRRLWDSGYVALIQQMGDQLNLTGYIANHHDPKNPLDFAKQRGWREAPDVVAELWWADIESMRFALLSDIEAELNVPVAAVEADMIDPKTTSAYLATEHCILDTTIKYGGS